MCSMKEVIAKAANRIIAFLNCSLKLSVATSTPAMAMMMAEHPTVGVSYLDMQAASKEEHTIIGIDHR